MGSTRAAAAALLAVLLALVALPACGVSTKTATSNAGRSFPSSTTSVGATGPPELRLDASSMGSYDLKVGQMVELTLSVPGMRWSGAEVTPTGLLTPDPAPSPPTNGYLGIWTAAATGTVTITAVGEAACAAGVACPQYARLFRVSLVIS